MVKDRIHGGDIEIKCTPTEKMWCDILTKTKQGQFFCEFCGYLMNVSADYDDDAERLLIQPNLLPHVEAEPTLSENCKSIILKLQGKQKRASVYFAKDVLFENKSTTKDIQSTKRSLYQRVQKQTSTPLKYRRSVLDYCKSIWSVRSLKERLRAKSVVRHPIRGQMNSARGLVQDQPRSDGVERQ